MLDKRLVPRKLSEVEQSELALAMSQYNDLDKLVQSQHSNQLRLHEATYLDIDNEVADYKMMALVIAKAIKFSIH